MFGDSYGGDADYLQVKVVDFILQAGELWMVWDCRQVDPSPQNPQIQVDTHREYHVKNNM